MTTSLETTKRLALADFADYNAATKQLAELRARRQARIDSRAQLSATIRQAEAEGHPRRAGVPLLRDRRRELDDEIRTLDDAIVMAERELECVRALHVSEIRDSARGEHEALVQQIADGAVRLAHLAEREHALRVEVEQSGASLPALGVTWVGSLRDRGSWVAQYLEECTRLGYDVTTAIRHLETYRATN